MYRSLAFLVLPVLVVPAWLSACSASSDAAPAGTDAPAVGEDGGPGREGVSPAPRDGGGVDAVPPPAVFQNPVLASDFPDPFVLRAGNSYFAYATNAEGKNVRAAKSDDLVTWTELPDVLPTLPSWAAANASLTWAPSVLARGNAFVLYFTARFTSSGFQCIGRAVAPDPAGPFVDDTTTPFICQVTLCGSIDPSPFVDENGDAYLLWKSDENAPACRDDARLWTQRLGLDGLSLVGQPVELLRRDRNWESPLVEGPSMIKRDGTYHLFYSAAWWESPDYAVGHATCATPFGPCEKKTLDAPLVASTADVLGPGGQEFFTDARGELWMAYHAWSSPVVGYTNGGARSLRIDRVDFLGETPALRGPTSSPQPR